MRINQDMLVGFARKLVEERAKEDRNLLAAYLQGSVLTENPFLGGTTDVDVVIVHNRKPSVQREIIPINDNIHLDIAHHEERDYVNPRQLRVHAWLGPAIFDAHILYDPWHKMDFVQAGVRGLYNHPAAVLERAQTQVQHAREMWMEFVSAPVEIRPGSVLKYFKTLSHAINGIALLNGSPLPERRVMLDFLERATKAGVPGLYAMTLTLLGSQQIDAEQIRQWLPAWNDAFDRIPDEKRTPRLHSARKRYYLNAIEETLDGESPMDTLWLLVKTWTQAVDTLPEEDAVINIWGEAIEMLKLGGNGFREQLDLLDTFLDSIEETLEKWGIENGS